MQIVDARNPLLFRCTDLEAYVREVDPTKKNLLLINKSDLLTPTQRCVSRVPNQRERRLIRRADPALVATFLEGGAAGGCGRTTLR